MKSDDPTRLADAPKGIPASCLDGCDAELFRIARAAYESPGRVYHTWKHVETCLAAFTAQSFAAPRSAFLALLFHDAIYVPGRSDNERESAILAERSLAAHSRVSESERQRVSRLILQTAAHHAEKPAEESDEALFLDIDLAILAASWPAYREYAEGVRSEFVPSAVSPAKFRVGRLRFLRDILRKDRIFHSRRYRSQDEIARDNLRRELALLEAEQGFVERLLSKLH